MIIDALLKLLIDLSDTLHNLGLPYIDELPWGIDSFLSSGVSGYKMLAEYFPPFQTVLTAFLIYMGFKVVLHMLAGVPIIGRVVHDKS